MNATHTPPTPPAVVRGRIETNIYQIRADLHALALTTAAMLGRAQAGNLLPNELDEIEQAAVDLRARLDALLVE